MKYSKYGRKPNLGRALLSLRAVSIAALNGPQSDLKMRQLAVWLALYLDPGPKTVRGLAAELGVPKPAISRALSRLQRLGVLERCRASEDRRDVILRKTAKGARLLRAFAHRIENAGARAPLRPG
jgi:DNA-binding MarR family transcriptional regulator